MDETTSSQPAPEKPPEPPPPASTPRSTRGLMIFGIIALVAVALIYLAHRYTSQVQMPAMGEPGGMAGQGVGQPAPDFLGKDIHGNAFTLADLKGKVVILDFWATWCGPCKAEIPWFIDLRNRYKAQGLEVVGVNSEEDADTVRPFAEKNRMNYPLVISDDKLATALGVTGLPTTFIIDRTGKIVARHVGIASLESFEEEIKKLL